MFRPLVAWADRFRVATEPSEEAPQSWALTVYRRSRLLDLMTTPFEQMMRWTYHWHPPISGREPPCATDSRLADIVWYVLLAGWAVYAGSRIYAFAHASLSWSDAATALGFGVMTLVRVIVLIAVASLVWTPIGVYVGLGPS